MIWWVDVLVAEVRLMWFERSGLLKAPCVANPTATWITGLH